MKITRLRAENVHGYLPFDIVFFPDLTFLTGLNGSGKTSALRLLMALLTPNLEEFALINFTTAAVTVEDAGNRIEIVAEKIAGELSLSVDGEKLVISSSELQLLSEIRRREEPSRNPVFEKVTSHKVYQYIKSLSTPMFLGIDRRHFSPTIFDNEMYEARRRQMINHRLGADDGIKGGSFTSLADVNYLVATRMQAIRAAQEKLDEDLRKKFFTRAFEYKPASLTGMKGPSRNELESYKQHLQNIQSASEALQVPLPDIQASLLDFFERMTRVVNLLESQSSPKAIKTVSRPKGKRWEAPPPVENVSVEQAEIQRTQVEWLINSPQADRIMEHLKLLEQYVRDRKALRDPIDRFLLLVNGFLKQTNKSVEVATSGDLAVRLPSANEDEGRSMAALSSGERQLLVMLAHLSLNPNLAGSGVFIVDEPELSLHIDWQEKFVEAVRKANPTVQLILATHSPAIILDRTDVCVSLSTC